ncbi:MAG: AAA domain-containing protein [Bacillota bacterium]
MKSIEQKYIFCREKIDVLHQKRDEMIKSEREYIKSRNQLAKLQQEVTVVSNAITGKRSEFNRLENQNPVFKLFTKSKRKQLGNELLDLREQEAIKKRSTDNQSYESATKKEAFITANQDYESYHSELSKCKIDSEQLNILENELNGEKDKIEQIEKQIENIQKELARIKDSEVKLLKNAKVVGTTLTSCTLNPQIRERTFNAAIVDEVSMAPCPSLFASCALATDKVMQCGDFYQLSPIADEKDAVWLKNSIFDKCGITHKVINSQGLKELAILDTQYRCHPDIANSIIDIVYKGKLKNGRDRNDDNFYAQNHEPFANNACVLLDTSKVFTISNPWCERKGESSWINPNTAELALGLAEAGLKSGIKSIGIVAPYSAQAKLIKSKLGILKEKYPDKKIEAATVHKYQGREMDMIVFDLIDGPPKYDVKFLKGCHGSEAMRLINVATTRAKGKLVVIANVDFIEQKLYKEPEHILYQWIQYLKTQKHEYLS